MLKSWISRSPLRLTGRGAGLGEFWRWWVAGLGGCVPDRVRSVVSPVPARLVLETIGQEVHAYRMHGGATTDLGTFPFDRESLERQLVALDSGAKSNLVLRLEGRLALSRDVKLPLATEQNLRQVLGFEMERYTPFKAEQVYYDYRVTDRDAKINQLKARLVVALRTTVDPYVAVLREAGYTPSAVDVVGESSRLNLLPSEVPLRRTSVSGKVAWVLFVMAMILALAAAVIPVWQQRELVLRLEPRLEQIRKDAGKVLAIKDELQNLREAVEFLYRKRLQTPLAIDILLEATRILPDGTWLQGLDIKGGTLDIKGESEDASSLIGIVADSPLFEQAKFQSTVTTDARTGRDRFHITATIVAPQVPGEQDGP